MLDWDVAGDERRALVRGVTPVVGIALSDDPPTLFCCFAVDDLDGALDAVVRAGGRVTATTPAVRDAGGTAADPTDEPFGRTATCTDDQGSRFYLGEL